MILMVTMHHSGIRGQVRTEGDRRAAPAARRGSAHQARRAPAGRPESETPWTFHLGYGALCLDFANTVSWRWSEKPVEHLPMYGELIRFAQQSRLLSEDEAQRLRREAARRPEAAARAWRKAVALRDALYRTFAGLANGKAPLTADLATLNESLPGAMARLQVATGDNGFGWEWGGDPQALDRLLWPVARDAAVFLTSADLSRLRTCGNPRCRWVFHDGTKSATRRWCSMAICGNRAKLQRYRRRRRRR
jgi:predicted RNA-binding Zn ribbon-like protein